MHHVKLPSGEVVTSLGLGTWKMGEDPTLRKAEIAVLQHAVEIGVTLIDTAEMYGKGKTEELVGEALADRRDRVFLVSKFYPHNASRTGVVEACERSLSRLRTDRIDLYLLHWRGDIPLSETVAGLEHLRQAGKIRYWGVSNFDRGDMRELWKVSGGNAVATNQVLYNLLRRGIEWDLLPWQRQHGIPLMAYSPLEQSRLLGDSGLIRFAEERSLSPAQVALAWIWRHGDVIAIPKTSSISRLEEFLAATRIRFGAEELSRLDQLFPPPSHPGHLEML